MMSRTKKLIKYSLATPIVSYAAWWAYDRSVTRSTFKICCDQAATLGDEKLAFYNAQPRHITVILNPVAGRGDSKKLYRNWVEPLLNLAGIKVSLVQTSSPKEAAELMKVMSNCDGVAVVGGDGTVNEVVNGLMNRPDRLDASHKFPMAILPVGEYNSIARLINQDLSYRNQKEFIIKATMGLIYSLHDKFDVLKVYDTTSKDDEIKTEPIFALRDIRAGKFLDDYFKISGYFFYQRHIKPPYLRFKNYFSTSKEQPLANVSYTKPCEGCLKCHEKHRLKNDHTTSRSWWRSLMFSWNQNELRHENPNCDSWINVESDNIDSVRATSIDQKQILVSLQPSDLEYRSQDVRISFEQPEKFYLDREPIEARSIEITTLSKAITVFKSK